MIFLKLGPIKQTITLFKTLKTPPILVLLLNGINAQSQVLLSLIFGDKLNSDGLKFGLKGGTNFSNISNLEKDKALTFSI